MRSRRSRASSIIRKRHARRKSRRVNRSSCNEPKPLAPVIPSPAITDGDDYSKVGPGPIAAIRFKWTARKDSSDDYFVDETIGEHSAPMITGPMTRDEAIQLVDQRESEARQRFEQFRHEMTGRAPPPISSTPARPDRSYPRCHRHPGFGWPRVPLAASCPHVLCGRKLRCVSTITRFRRTRAACC